MATLADETTVSPSEEQSGLPFRVGVICGLLLLASAINYMDRQTLSSTSDRILEEFQLSKEQYGKIEGAFGYGFVAGSIVFGLLADVISVRWLYPVVLLSWSGATAATAWAAGYDDLLWLRFGLGVFEAGHWPCGVRVVRALTRARGRTMGNGLLQSGTSIGAVVAPMIVLALLTEDLGSWRRAFVIVGCVGLFWVIAWFSITRSRDFPPPEVKKPDPRRAAVATRRLVMVLIVICLINTTWQVFRAWLHLFMRDGREYSETQTLIFDSVWFAATDIGCLGVGIIVLWIVARGVTVTRARQMMFTVCALACLTMLALPWLPKGAMLLAVLLLGGAGALGMFPLYHAFTQDISGKHQGKITGLAGVTAWFLVPFAQQAFGRLVDETNSYDIGLAALSAVPMVAAILLWFWGDEADDGETKSVQPA